MISPRRERFLLCALFAIQSHAQALWYVPFSTVLKAHGLEAFIPYAFACTAFAALLAPMISGTLADRHYPAPRVLRWLATGVGLSAILVFLGIERHWGIAWVVTCFLFQQFCYVPTWGISSAIVLSRLENPQRDFGPVRVWATLGWLLAGPLTSFVLHADTSTISGFAAAAGWLCVAGLTWILPEVLPQADPSPRRWRDLFGWDAFELFRDPNHRAVLLTSAFLSIPLAALYQSTVLDLASLGETRGSAAMSLGQVTEVIAMYALAPVLARFPVKAVFLTGIFFGIVRYALFILNSRAALLSGILLHGFCFSFFFVVSQIYFDTAVAPAFRVRAQLLLTLLTSGIGSLVGALACGWWKEFCTGAGGVFWPLHWALLCGMMAASFVFFAMAYRGGKGRLHAVSRAAGDLPGAAQPMIANTPE